VSCASGVLQSETNYVSNVTVLGPMDAVHDEVLVPAGDADAEFELVSA